MEKTLKIFFATILFTFMNSHASHAEIKLSDEFVRAAKDSGMIFEPPRAGYDTVDVPKNEYMRYNVVIRAKTYNLEIRYTIQRMPKQESPLSYFRAFVENITQSDDYHEWLDLHDVGADWGAMALFPPKPSFASPFDLCFTKYIHKDDRGDAFIIFLYNDKEFNSVWPEMQRMFYSLRFK